MTRTEKIAQTTQLIQSLQAQMRKASTATQMVHLMNRLQRAGRDLDNLRNAI